MSYQYKFELKQDKDNLTKEDFNKVIIQKNITAEFTLSSVLENIEEIKKNRRQMEATAQLERAKMGNIIINARNKLSTDDLEKMTEQDLQTMFVYSTSWYLARKAEEKLKQIQDAEDKVSFDLQEILRQTKLSLTPKTTKEKADEIVNAPVVNEDGGKN